jgi:hypothetical protein
MIVMRNAHEIPAPGEGIGSLLNYQNGFGNEFGTEALEGALPTGRNSPQRCGYVANRSMVDRFFYDADGELLIVPQLGRLRLATELGILDISRSRSRSFPAACASVSSCPTGKPAATSARTSARGSGQDRRLHRDRNSTGPWARSSRPALKTRS